MKYDEALRSFEKALELAPDNYQAAYNLGMLYRQMGKPGKSKEYFQKANRLKR